MEWVKRLGIKHFRGIYSRDGLPKKIRKECGIINLDDITGPGTHWVCYRNLDSVVEYFDPFGLIMPNEALSASFKDWSMYLRFFPFTPAEVGVVKASWKGFLREVFAKV